MPFQLRSSVPGSSKQEYRVAQARSVLDGIDSDAPSSTGEAVAQSVVRVHGGATPVQHTTSLASSDSGNLDLLRSVAVLLVLVFHVALVVNKERIPLTPLNLKMVGVWGVLMFFVHTSYVLMLSLERQARRAPADQYFPEFMVRRMFRLLPLSTFAVICVVTLGLPVADFPFRAAAHRWFALLTNLLLVQNLTRSDSVIATLWSLPYEMQMYLVLPALFAFSRRYRTLAPVLGLWAVCAIASVIWMPNLGAFYDMPVYVPCFLAGVVGYQYANVGPTKAPFFLWPIALAIVSLAYLAHPSISVGWACCLALGLLIPSFRELTAGVSRDGVRLIARYSYGIYLSHFICLWFAFVACSSLARPIQWLVLAVSLVALPVVMYHVIEAPMISVGARIIERWRTARDVRLRLAARPLST